MADCNICAEKFNKSNHSAIKCYCGFICCKVCLKTYILSIDEPECMSNTCTIVFDKKFLSQNFDKKFLTTTYKLHRENVLFNMEMALLPATQLQLEQIKNKELVVTKGRVVSFKIALVTSFLEEITEIKRNLKKNIKLFPRKCPILTCTHVISNHICYECENNLSVVYHTNNAKYVDNVCNVENLYNIEDLYKLQSNTFINENQPKAITDIFNLELLNPIFIFILYCVKQAQYVAEKATLNEQLVELRLNKDNITIESEFIRQCPNENCNGFLSYELNCKLCNCFACNDCREIIQEDHKCDPKTVETIKLLALDTKLCPGCTVPIYKINGCDNMYCIKCKVSFRWTTLKIKSVVDRHNPEYLADMSRIAGGYIPRDPNDILCGRELDYSFKNRLVNKCKFGEVIDDHRSTYYVNQIYIKNIVEKIIYIKQAKLVMFANEDTDNNNLRMDYLKNIINKENFQIKLQRIEKRKQKNQSLFNILNLYINCMTDLFYKVESNPKKFIADFKIEIIELKKITNAELATSAKMYNTTLYTIDKNYEFTNFRYEHDQTCDDCTIKLNSLFISNETDFYDDYNYAHVN